MNRTLYYPVAAQGTFGTATPIPCTQTTRQMRVYEVPDPGNGQPPFNPTGLRIWTIDDGYALMHRILPGETFTYPDDIAKYRGAGRAIGYKAQNNGHPADIPLYVSSDTASTSVIEVFEED